MQFLVCRPDISLLFNECIMYVVSTPIYELLGAGPLGFLGCVYTENTPDHLL